MVPGLLVGINVDFLIIDVSPSAKSQVILCASWLSEKSEGSGKHAFIVVTQVTYSVYKSSNKLVYVMRNQCIWIVSILMKFNLALECSYEKGSFCCDVFGFSHRPKFHMPFIWRFELRVYYEKLNSKRKAIPKSF